MHKAQMSRIRPRFLTVRVNVANVSIKKSPDAFASGDVHYSKRSVIWEDRARKVAAMAVKIISGIMYIPLYTRL